MQKIKSVVVITLILVLSFLFVGCTTTDQTEPLTFQNAYITLDINPSIEIITGEDGLVTEVNGLNDDAFVLLVDTNFAGKTISEVVEALMQLATDTGFIGLDEENAILITSTTDTPEENDELEKTIEEKVKEFVNDRKIKLDLITANLAATEDIKATAEELGISVGKVKLITYAMGFDDTLTLEAAAQMSVRDLNKIIINGRKEVKDFYSEEIKDAYLDQKDEVKFDFKVKVIELLNGKVQEAPDEVFTNLLAKSVATVSDVKAFYQAYYDELYNFEIPTENDTENTELLEQIENLYMQMQTIKEELRTLYKDIRNPRLTKEELEALLEQVKEKVLAERELNEQINELTKNLKGKWNGFENPEKGHKNGKLIVNFTKNFNFEKRVNINTYFHEITKKYQQMFADINVDIHELEALFKDELSPIFETLEQEKETVIEGITNDLQAQAQIIREQVIEENKVLKDIWKNPTKGRK